MQMARIAAGHFVTMYRLKHSLVQQVFRYLNGIGGSALAQVIAHDPAVEVFGAANRGGCGLQTCRLCRVP